MCGIGGALSYQTDLQSLVPLILKDQQRRGPDHASSLHLVRDQLNISLAHNRLAIVDLTDRSNQPFFDAETDSYIVFNGEIYNYVELKKDLKQIGIRFQTESDTEVLLKGFLHWGPSVFEKLNGMFAFAIWQPKIKKLTLARDRFGVKPCYYVKRQSQFAFASTTQALADFFNLEPNLDYLGTGLRYALYEQSNGISPYKEMQSLPPGHYLEVDDNSLKVQKFYNLSERVNHLIDQLAGLDEKALIQQLEDRFRSAIEIRLRSDVPVTVSLSGGLDSALVTAFMRENSPNRDFQAFTFGTLDNPHNEAVYAKKTADHLGFDLHFADVKADHVVEAFERTLHAQGAPFAHPTVIAQNCVFEAMNKKGYKVALGGQGADEAFLGYRKFQVFQANDLYRKKQFFELSKSLPGLLLTLAADSPNIKNIWRYLVRYLARSKSSSGPSLNHPLLNIGFSSYEDLRDRQLADVDFASLSTLLRYEDRNSMGSSVESRLPFLDYRIVEFGVALPAKMKIRTGYGKWILRRLAENRLPQEIFKARSKKAFALDPQYWLKNGLADHLYGGVQRNLPIIEQILGPQVRLPLQDRTTYMNPQHFPLAVTAYWLGQRINRPLLQ